MHKLVVGCGYLGERVARAWKSSGDEVCVLTRSPTSAERFRRIGFVPIVGDVLDPASLRTLPAADTLLYAVGFDRSAGHSYREVYVDGLRNVLAEVAGRADRVIYISSTSVYGQSQGELVDETAECRPESDNGQVCLDAERVFWERVRSADPAAKPSAQVLRLAGIYGPGRLLRRVEQVRAGEPLTGNPEAFLNLIHVDDAVRAVLACEARGLAGATYLVADDRPVRRLEYYTRLALLLGAPAPTFAPGAEVGDLNKRCSNRRLRDELQVELQFPTIDEGLPHALGSG